MPSSSPRVTGPLIKIGRALWAEDDLWLSEVCRRADLPIATAVGVLQNMSGADLVEHRMEAGAARELGSPLRRFYRLTAAGEAWWSALVAEYELIPHERGER